MPIYAVIYYNLTRQSLSENVGYISNLAVYVTAAYLIFSIHANDPTPLEL